MKKAIKTLAKTSLEKKWGEGEILEISKDFTYSCNKLDKETGETYINIVDLKEACAFCYDALERTEIKSDYHINDKIDIPSCENCLIPRFVCSHKASEGLMGMLSRLFTKYYNKKEDIILIIDLIRDCLRQLRNFGKISLSTEKFISTLEVK